MRGHQGVDVTGEDGADARNTGSATQHQLDDERQDGAAQFGVAADQRRQTGQHRRAGAETADQGAGQAAQPRRCLALHATKILKNKENGETRLA